MRAWVAFLCWVIAVFGSLKGETVLSFEQCRALEGYLRHMIACSEGEALIFGGKPVLTTGSPIAPGPAYPSLFAWEYCLGAELERAGLEIWDALSLDRPTSPICITTDPSRSNHDSTFFSFRWIHREGVLQTVEQHLPLFRHVLGPATTPQRVLADLENPDRDFFDVVAHDHSLVGILLGYGAENSQIHSRERQIFDKACQLEQLPFAARLHRCEKSDFGWMIQPSGRFQRTFDHEALPSYPFDSIGEELEVIQKDSIISRHHPLAEGAPIPWFGCKESSQESCELIQRYKQAADKGAELLASNTFLQDAIGLLTGRDDIHVPETWKGYTPPPVPQNVAAGIARALQRGVPASYQGEFSSLLAGMRSADREEPLTLSLDCYDNRATYPFYLEGRKNYESAEALLADLDLPSIVSGKLLYEIVEPGESRTDLLSHVTFHARVSPLVSQEQEADYFNSWMRLEPVETVVQDLLPGIALGLQEMAIGERRILYLHPDLAYGYDSNFESGVALKITLELLETKGEPCTPNLSFHAPPEELLTMTQERVDQNVRDFLFVEGYRCWEELREDAPVTLDAIVGALESCSDDDLPAFFQYQRHLFSLRHGDQLFPPALKEAI